MIGKLTLLGLILHIVFSAVLYRKHGLYLKTMKPEGGKKRVLLRRWEEILLIAVEILWVVVLFRMALPNFQEMVGNGAIGLLIALVFTFATPIIAPPFLYIIILLVLLRENRKRRKSEKST